MTFSMRQLVQDTHSRDRMEEYNYSLQQRDEVPDEEKLEGELQQRKELRPRLKSLSPSTEFGS